MAWEDNAEQVLPYGVQETDRAAWLAVRRQGIGGSDARVLMGCGYADESEFTVLQSKLLALPDREDNIRWRRGTAMEEFIADEFTRSELAGWPDNPQRTGTWINRERPWQLANPDWRIGQRGMESKHLDNYANAKAYRALAGPPPRFYWQCLNYMDCLGAEGWWLAIDSPFYSQLLVHYLDAGECAEDMALLRERVGNWWESHIVHGFELAGGGRVEPAPERQAGVVVEAALPELALECLARLRELKYPNTKAGKEEAARLNELLKTQLGTADVLAVDGVPVLRWASRRNPGQPDWSAIEKATGKKKQDFMTSGATSWFLAEIDPPTKEE